MRQGDNLLPNLFAAALEEIFKRTELDQMGIQINGELLKNLRFSDDIALFAKTRQELKEMIRNLSSEGLGDGMRMNFTQDFLRNRNTPNCPKRKIMNRVIIPAMTYGSETWSLTGRQAQKLRAAQRAVERAMLGMSRVGKWRNERIRAETGVEDVVRKAKLFKWKWAGHVAIMSHGRWSKRVSEWTPGRR